MVWTLLSAAAESTRPAARERHGFMSAGSKLYVHGGSSNGSEYGVVNVKVYEKTSVDVVRGHDYLLRWIFGL